MSLITTAGLWNPNEIDYVENNKTTRRVSSQQQQHESQKESFGPQSYPDTNKNINAILDKINNVNIKNAGDNLMKFNPINPPKVQIKKDIETDILPVGVDAKGGNKVYNSQNLADSKNYGNYKSSYSPTITPLANLDKKNIEGFKSNDNLMERINYMINLLEEQKAQKTDHMFEEFLLYSFVGVFVIFVVDSFNRSVKYSR
jgi:hypothetical protein